MILEKIKRLHNEFGHFSNKECADLGFNPRIESNDTLKRFLRKKGKWSSLTFSVLQELEWGGSIRIIPDLPGSQWPVYYLFKDGGTFEAGNMLAYTLFVHIKRLNKDFELCKQYHEEWNAVYQTILPVYKLFEGTDDLQEIKDIIFNKGNWPKPDEENEVVLTKYRAFSLKHDSSPGNKYLWDLLDHLIGSKDILPDLPEEDLGVHISRVMKLVSVRAEKLISLSQYEKFPYEKLEKPRFSGFIAPHGYDTAQMYPSYFPASCVDEKRNIMSCIDDILNKQVIVKNSSELKGMPEYGVAKALYEQGEGRFKATEFLQAAAILDEEYKEPKRAWNCLVSAGYWAGENLPEGQDTIVKAAIYLCEKHNWLEAAEVLKYNLDIMQSV